MTLQEIAQEMLKEVDRYTTIQEVAIPKLVQARTHKKWRINKKWQKRYGMKTVYEKRMAQVADITIEDVLEFCHEKGLPMPMEILQQSMRHNDQTS